MNNQIDFTVIDGIRYYPTPTSCISEFEKRSWIKKALSIITSFGTLFLHAINKALKRIRNVEKQMEHYTQAPIPHFSTNKLILGLHGVNDDPTQFEKIVKEINLKDTSKADIYIPKILEKGNAKLNEMVAPIIANIAEWAKTGEEKELVLIGISNGGRLARAIKAELINSGQFGKIKQIRFISIVGACQGSSMVDLAKKLGLSWLLLSKNIAEEMGPNSARFKQLEADMLRSKTNTEVKQKSIHIASPHDWTVPNYSSTLMEVAGSEVKYALIPNHGHQSIVDAVAKSVAKLAMSLS